MVGLAAFGAEALDFLGVGAATSAAVFVDGLPLLAAGFCDSIIWYLRREKERGIVAPLSVLVGYACAAVMAGVTPVMSEDTLSLVTASNTTMSSLPP